MTTMMISMAMVVLVVVITINDCFSFYDADDAASCCGNYVVEDVGDYDESGDSLGVDLSVSC
jgi:hypothetical protein